MSSESLQKVFKTLADPTRVRILAALEREELAVQELMEVLALAQSRVSRHLGILRESGLVRDRRDGTFVLYRFSPPAEGPWAQAWRLVRESLADDPSSARDNAALDRVVAARAAHSRSFFDALGPEWDALRKIWSDDLLRARALMRLIPGGLRVADIGTGTGVLALELARLGVQVIAVDHSERMLEAARAKLADEALEGVELRLGEASALPIEDASVDAAFAHMVLQYLPSPGEAVREMARITTPGGRVVVVDFARHEREWMREELGVLRLGFEADEIAGLFAEAGLADFALESFATPARGNDLPDTFIASGTRPDAGAAA